MWRLSQTGGQSAGLRELRNLRVFARWAQGSKTPALLDFLPCTQKVAGKNKKPGASRYIVRERASVGKLRGLGMGQHGAQDPTADGSQSHR